ncbi:hypothetical protein [Novosphingobium sp.]|uniref:hypothetical protein n=1 Tax=Novosphingobium sp. TaxID=1874826 RepID=UPI002735E530|nr:hypothetical protein [Novosphingobium sp.]MDP3908297.1 hypothetical protein [Novosphingobium sp.]
MNRLMWVLHAMVATTLMGAGVTAVLAANLPGWQPIAIAAAIGFVAALPVSWLIARRIEALTAPKG